MKKITTLIAVLFISFLAVSAQDTPNNAISVSAVYNRSGVTFKNIRGEEFKYDADRDSVGFEVSYLRFLGKSPVGIGMEGGVTFHDKDVSRVDSCGTGCTVTQQGNSKVAVGYANYKMVLQDRKGAFQPFIGGVAGIHRGNFDGISSGPGGSFRVGGGSTFVFGATGGFDIKLSKRLFWSSGVTVLRGINKETETWHVRPKTGLTLKF